MTERTDLLISRIAAGESSAAEWNELSAMADAEPAIWRDLAEAQRDAAALELLARQAGDCAAGVELSAVDASTSMRARPTGARSPLLRLVAWSGWAAAAAVVLAWVLAGPQDDLRHPPPQTPVRTVQLATPEEALRAYIDRGREAGSVIAELPEKILVESRPAASGEGYELLFLRQLLERTQVNDLYQFSAQDEQGRPRLVRLNHEPGGSL